MGYNQYNNDFLSYYGRINRKNYVINVVILFALYVAISFVNFSAFTQFFSYKFLATILMFLVELFKFVLVVSIISTVYRRINDFSTFDGKIKNLFIIFYFVPFIYLSFGHYMLDFFPAFLTIFDYITFYFLLPIAVILTIIFAFMKSK